MEITDIRIKLAEKQQSKLLAFATITFDGCFVVRDLKVIQGTSGLFVAMPSRKLTARCPRCRCKNHLRAKYCNECGTKLRPPKMKLDERGRAKLHSDVAHPINQDCRDSIQAKVIAAYQAELERAKQQGYTPPEEDFLDAGPEGPEEEDDLAAASQVDAGEVQEPTSDTKMAATSRNATNASEDLSKKKPQQKHQEESGREMRV